MHLITHIVAHDQWTAAQQRGSYEGDTLATEGFIHCSTPQQVPWVANRFYIGRDDLLLLCIDADRLRSELRYEESEVNQQFPHIYGPLNLDAVIEVVPFARGSDGRFVLPDRVEALANTAH